MFTNNDPSFQSATQINSSSGNQAAATATATLPAITNRFNYLSGFEITAGGGTAAAILTATITGCAGGTMSYAFPYPTGATLPATPLTVEFFTPMQASGPGVAIAVSLPAIAGGTNACVCAHGFVL